MHVGDARDDAVAAGDAPFVLVSVILDRVHGLTVGCGGRQEAFVFGAKGGEVEAGHFEGAALGVPGCGHWLVS